MPNADFHKCSGFPCVEVMLKHTWCVQLFLSNVGQVNSLKMTLRFADRNMFQLKKCVMHERSYALRGELRGELRQ